MAAQKNNQRAFPSFARKLKSNDFETFRDYSEKLGRWIGSEKAYYQEARPEIITLLEIAQATVRRQVQNAGGDPDAPISVTTVLPYIAPWVEVYSSIVKVIVRFTGRFPEPELLDRLRAITSMGNVSSVNIGPSSNQAPRAATQRQNPNPNPMIDSTSPAGIDPTTFTSTASSSTAAPSASCSILPQVATSLPKPTTPSPSAAPCEYNEHLDHSYGPLKPPEESTEPLQNPHTVEVPERKDIPAHDDITDWSTRISNATARIAAFKPSKEKANVISPEKQEEPRDILLPELLNICLPESSVIQATSLPASSSQAQLQNVVSHEPIEREFRASDAASKSVPPLRASPADQYLPAQATFAPESSPVPIATSVDICVEPSSQKHEVKSPVPKSDSRPVLLPPENTPDVATAILSHSSSATVIHAAPTPTPKSKSSTPITPILASTSTTSIPGASLKAKKRRLAISADLIAADLALAKKKRKVDNAPDIVRTSTPDKRGIPVPDSSPRNVLEASSTKADGDGDVPTPISDTSSIHHQPLLLEGNQQNKRDAEPSVLIPEEKASGTTKIAVQGPEPADAPPLSLLTPSTSKDTAILANSQVISQEVAASEAPGQPVSTSSESLQPGLDSLHMTANLIVDELNHSIPAPHYTVSDNNKDVYVSNEISGQSISSPPEDISPKIASPLADIGGNVDTQDVVSEDVTKDISPVPVPTHERGEAKASLSADLDRSTMDISSSSYPVDSGDVEASAYAPTDLDPTPSVVDTSSNGAAVESSAIEVHASVTTDLDTTPSIMNISLGGVPVDSGASEHSPSVPTDLDTTPHVADTSSSVFAVESSGWVEADVSVPTDLDTTSHITDISSSIASANVNAVEDTSVLPDGVLSPQDGFSAAKLSLGNQGLSDSSLTHSTSQLASRDKAADFWPSESSTSNECNDDSMDISIPSSPNTGPAVHCIDPEDTANHHQAALLAPVKEEDVMDFLGTITLGASPSMQEANAAQHQLPTPPATGDPTQSRFGSTQSGLGHDMYVIAAQRGSASAATFVFNFDLDSAQRVALHLWQHRKTISADVTNSLCLSVACYKWSDFFSHMKDHLSLDEATSRFLSDWSSTAGLSMRVMSGKEEWYLPLSPPFSETAEGLVDVSEFAEASSNSIRLVQTCDMSDFVFVLHAHHPTPSQMEEESIRREKEQAWRDALKRLAQPPTVPFLWGEKAISLH